MISIEPLRADNWPALLYSAQAYLPDDKRMECIRQALSLLTTGVLDPRGVFVARANDQIIGVQVCVPLAGKSCLFWPPAAPAELADTLVQAGLAWSRSLGCKLAQAFPGAAESLDVAPLERNGFRRITRMLRLQHSLSGQPQEPPALRAVPYSASLHAVFAATLARTYEGTLDCPELCGARTMDEVLAGHRGEGKFDPNFWWLVHEGNRPAGVVLLMELHDGITWDLAYLGVVPELRRRGLARLMLRHAMHALHCQPATRLTLAVDARNEPALRLYHSFGFVEFEVNDVWLYFFVY